MRLSRSNQPEVVEASVEPQEQPPVEAPEVQPVVEAEAEVAPVHVESAREKAKREHAAGRRADYVRALNEEREMCERIGKADRVAAIDAELDRVQGRTAPQVDEA